MTALHYMAKYDGSESLRLLLSHGAEIDAVNNVRRKTSTEFEASLFI